jgi:hypothetical protein
VRSKLVPQQPVLVKHCPCMRSATQRTLSTIGQSLFWTANRYRRHAPICDFDGAQRAQLSCAHPPKPVNAVITILTIRSTADTLYYDQMRPNAQQQHLPAARQRSPAASGSSASMVWAHTRPCSSEKAYTSPGHNAAADSVGIVCERVPRAQKRQAFASEGCRKDYMYVPLHCAKMISA